MESQTKVNVKDCKTIEELDFNELELTRGDTPDDIIQRCLQLCKDYLSGNWVKQTVDTIEFRRISGGLTNQLYYCAIADPSKEEDVPQEVAIRLYGPKHFNNLDHGGNERLTDMIIALQVSANGLGPKVYGIFEDGQILGYYKHRQFKLAEQKVLNLTTQMFEKLAQVHAMKVPLKKTNWLFDFFDTSLETGYKKFPINELLEECKCETMLRHDIHQEIAWLKGAILKINSPVLFTHIDFRSQNIMITEPNDEIVLCDFEYSAYGYRGFDFGTCINEWGRVSVTEFNDLKYPCDSVIEPLIEIYVKESERLLGKKYSQNPNNSVKQIMREVKLFSLVANVFVILIGIKNDDKNPNEFPIDKKVMLGLSELSYKYYWQLKDEFMRQHIF